MIIIFDADKSTSVIEDFIDPEKCVIRPVNSNFETTETENEEKVTVHGMDYHIRHYTNKLFKKRIVTYKDPIFGYEDTQTMVVMNAKAKELGLHTIVIDSISGAGEAIRLSLIDDSRFSTMTMDLWGKYAVRLSRLTAMVRDLPIHVILTCHIEHSENDIGSPIQFPAVKGSQKTDMLRWFDVIIYTHVDDKGQITWEVKPSDIRTFIRSRKPIPEWGDDRFVDPDFGPIYKTYDKAKILLIGDSGTGKTTSLLTIPNVRKDGKRSKPNKSKDAPTGDVSESE